MRPLPVRERRNALNLPNRIKGSARPPKGPVDVPERKGTTPQALISQVLRLDADEVVTLELDTPEECERLGLSIDAQRKAPREKYGADIRVGIDGSLLRLWKDAWAGEGDGPTGEEE